MKSYVVIGMGRFGKGIATRLYEYGEEVIAIDLSEEIVNEIADSVTRAVCADAKDTDVLKALGVKECDCAIVAIGSDLASSVLITMNLKNIGVPHIVCKAKDDIHREILEKLGANEVVIPERVVAEKLARTLVFPDIFDTIDFSNDYGIVEWKAPDNWQGKSLQQLNVRDDYGINVIAIRSGNETNIAPTGSTIIQKDMVLVLLGNYKSIEKMKKA